MKKRIKNTSQYRGSLITFQHYLNTYNFILPMEETNIQQGHMFYITSWYKGGILDEIHIKRKPLTK